MRTSPDPMPNYGHLKTHMTDLISDIESLERELNTLKGDLDELIKLLSIPADILKDLKTLNKDLGTVDEILEVTSLLMTEFPEISEPLSALKQVIGQIREDLLTPAQDILTPFVKTLNETVINPLKAAEKKVITPTLNAVKTVDEDITSDWDKIQSVYGIINNLPDSSCKTKAEQDFDAFCGGLDNYVSPIDTAIKTVKDAAENAVNTFSQELEPVLSALQDVKNTIEGLSDTLQNDIDPLLKPIKDALNTKIKLEVTIHTIFGSIHLKVGSFSINEILKDINKIISGIEHILHIDDAKKWLEGKINQVIRGLMNKIEKSIEKMVVKKFDFNAANAEALLSKFQGYLDKIGNEWSDAITQFEQEMQKLQNLNLCQ